MKFKKSFGIALNIIVHSKLRSWLTIIGIVIGIAAVVSIVSLGQGAQRNLEQNLNSLNANLITISPGSSRAAGAGASFRGGGGFGGGETGGGSVGKNLTVTDVTLLRGVPNVDQVMGTISGSVDTTYLSKSSKTNIEGVDPAVWKNTISTQLAYGRYLTQGDINSVVVGGRVANSTFGDIEINRQISIGGKSFNIVGILQQSGGSDDGRIFMPIVSAVPLIEGKDSKSFDSITVIIKDISLTDTTVADITSKLMMSHAILQASKNDFTVTSQKALQERVSSALGSASLFLGAIAAISLLVGAIGIMNTMFTSVLERTKEIGILKAIGAKNSDILMIFLLNAGIIGLIGGFFGIVLGIVGSSFIGGLAGLSLGRFSLSSDYINFPLIFEVFILSVVVGLISGAIPAYRASKLKPVDALRYE